MDPEDSSKKQSRREEDVLEPMYDFMEELLSIHNGKPQTERDARKAREQQDDTEKTEPRGSWSEKDRAISEIYGKGFLVEMIRILEPAMTGEGSSSAGGEERRSMALDRIRRYKSEVEERKRRLAIEERVRDCYEEIEWRMRRAEEDQQAIKQRQEEVNECRQKLDQIQADETEEGKEDGVEKADRLVKEVLELREGIATDERLMRVIKGQLTDERLCYSFEGRADMDMQWARTQEKVKVARELERERTKEIVEEITGWMEEYELIVPAKASRGQLPLVSSQTRERVPHSSMQNTAQCKAIHYYLLYLLIHPSPGTRLV